MANPLSFSFWADEPNSSPLSYDALQSRRRIAESLLGKRMPFPQNAGQGIAYLTEKLSDRATMDALDAEDRRQGAYEGAVRAGAPPEDYLPRTQPPPGAPPIAALPSTEPKVYEAGDFNPIDAAGSGGAVSGDLSRTRGVDPRLVSMVTAGASYLPEGYTVRPTSGVRPGDPGYHGGGRASDWQIIDPQGKAIPNTGDDTTGLYTRLARGAYTHAQQNYPALAGRLGWGGAFDKSKRGDTGVPDLMHFDLGGDRGNLRPGNQLRRLGPLNRGPGGILAPQSGIVPPDAVATELGNEVPPPGAQTASLPPDAMSDAQAPVGLPPDATAQANPPIVTDVAPAPSMMMPGSIADTVPADFARRPPSGAQPLGPALPPPDQGIQRAPATLPSQEPIPPAKRQVMPHPGPAPVQEPILGPSTAMKYWAGLATRPDISPTLREHAKQQYQIGEQYRQAEQTRRDEAFKNEREKHEAKVRLWDDFQLKEHDRDIKQLGERESLEMTRANLAKLRQEMNKPEVIEGPNGQKFERPPGPAGTAFAPVVGVPGSEKLTEKQAAMLQHFQVATVTDKQLGNDSTLAGLRETVTGKVPLVGNYTLTPEFQQAKNAADAWLLAHIRNQSGAVIGRDEIPQYWHLYFPVPGDTDHEIRNKQERRKTLTEGLYDGLGDAKPVADKFLQRLKENAETNYPEGTKRTSRSTGKQQILRGGKWEDQ